MKDSPLGEQDFVRSLGLDGELLPGGAGGNRQRINEAAEEGRDRENLLHYGEA
jgi:hypothetical protein